MGNLTVQEISSLLSTRVVISEKESRVGRDDEHRNWDPKLQASVVILWGLLIYPQLDPSVKKLQKGSSITLEHVYRTFKQHLGTEKTWKEILLHLRKYDYIRFKERNRIVAGTRLWTAIDAAKMYTLLRTSVLVRQFDSLGETSENR